MSFNVSSFLDKTRSKDKDLRHMALLDLHAELEKDSVRIDESSQKKVADAVLLLIEDTSAEVQGAAVKCFEPLVKKLTQKQIEDWIGKLVANITGEEEEKRDISNMALKTLVSKIPAENAYEPIKKALNILLETCNPKVDEEIKMESLDVMTDILGRFGGVLSNKHKDLQNAFIGELTTGSSSLQKRVINCLSALSVHLNDDLFKKLFQFVLTGIEKESNGENLGVYILLCSSIAKSSGYRTGKYLKDVVPLLVKVADIVAEKDEDEDDVRENIMLAFVSFIQMTPDEAKEFIDYYIILSKEYLEYDPNYSYDDSDDDEMEVEENQEDVDDQDEEEGGFSDDDDVSWKVRKGAAKCLLTLIQTYPEYINSAYTELCSEEDHTLVSRFKEREEGVKLDVFQVFSALLKQSVIWGPSNQVIKQKDQIKTLQQMTDVIMIRLKKQLKERSSKVRQGVFEVLKDLVVALQGGLEEHIKSLVPFICNALNDKRANSSLKLEVLLFLENLLNLHKPQVFGDSYEKLSKSVFVCVQDRFYKVISESLRVCGGLVSVVSTFNGTDKFNKTSSELFKEIYDRLCLQDIDKDVKEAAIEAMGELISKIGKGIEKENLSKALKVLLERLKNEITRLTTCRTFSTIAISEQANLSNILVDLIEELSSLLKKNNRTLRQASLISLSNFVTHYGKSIDSKQYNLILEEIKSLLNHIKDTDLALSQLAFDLVINILNENGKMSTTVQKLILPSGLSLLESSTLQGGTLKSFALFLQVMVGTCGFSSLLSNVLDSVQNVKSPVPKQIYVNIGKCVSSLLNKATEQEFKKTVEKFVKEIKSQDDNVKLLALFSLGEIGSHNDISSYNIKNDIEACFDSGSEEVKNAASTSLGNISVGNLSNYLPSILDSISKQPKRKYLLLHSLKEIISTSTNLSSFIKDIMPLLFEDCDNSEEGIRNVVSECLGKLAVVDYATVVPELKSKLESKSEDVKSTIISAMKYTISDKDKSYDKQLSKDIFKFLKYLDKKQHHKVRRATVLLLTAALHSKPSLVVNNLGGILTKLYEDSVIDKSLLRKVDVGPFKIDVDDGIDLRKSVYECMETLLENCVDRIDTIKFASQFTHGFADENSDIKMLSHLMLQKLCEISPAAVLHVVDDLCEPLKATMTTKLKENAVQTDKDRHAELIRSSIKATYSLSRVKGIEDSIKFTDLLNKTVKANSNLENLYESIQDKHKE